MKTERPGAEARGASHVSGEHRERAVLELSATLASSLVLEDVLATVARRIGEIMDVWWVDIWNYSSERDALIYEAYWCRGGVTDQDLAYVGTVTPLDERPEFRRLLEGGRAVECHIDDPDLAPEERAAYEKWGQKATLDAPLLFGDRVIGTLGVGETRRVRHFSDDERELFEQLCVVAAIAIHNAKMFRRQEEQTRFMASLIDSSRAITSTVDLDEVLDRVVREAATALAMTQAVVYEYEPAAEAIVYRALYEREPASVPHDELGTAYPFDAWPGERAIVFGDGLTVEHVGDAGLSPDRARSMEIYGEKTVLSVPLRYGDQRVGILRLYDMHDERLVTDAELRLARGLGEQAAIAIINARLFRQIDATQRRLEALLDSSRALTSSLVLEEVIDTVTGTGAAALASPRCLLYEFDRASDTLTARAYAESSPTPGYAEIGVPLPLAKMPGNRAILDSRVPVIAQVADQGVDKRTRAKMAHWGEFTALNVPLFYKDEALGILMFIETEAERHYTPDELALAAGIGEQASIALQNARLYRRQEAQNARLLALLESSRAMTASLSAQQTVDGMKAEISNLLSGIDCKVGVHLGRDEGGFETFAAQGERRSTSTRRLAKPDAIVIRALEQKRPVQVGPVKGRTRLVIPLLVKEEPSGFVDLSGRLDRPFSDDEIEVAQILANQTAVAVENARLYERIERQAITDGLTGLYNHREFHERLRTEVARSWRYNTPLSLLMLDIDDFKQFNDTYGHVTGDDVLRAVGRLLLTGLRRDVDVAARYGGEEFAIILPNTPVDAAHAVGERMRATLSGGGRDGASARGRRAGDASPVAGCGDAPAAPGHAGGAAKVGERLRREIEHATVLSDQGSPLEHVTVSVGVAAFPDHAGDAGGLVKVADGALYAAKHAGKNQVAVADLTRAE
jgi:GAF domain-containing protein